jgi:hypothetical protein
MVLAVGARITRRGAIFTRRDLQFILLFAGSYAAWLGVFSIHRYAIVLELLCAPLCPAAGTDRCRSVER